MPVQAGPTTLVASAACLVAAASYGFAGACTERLAHPVSPTSMATGSQIAAALLLLPLVPFGPPLATPTPSGATLLLGVVCTALAYPLNFRLIRDIGATRALTVTFLIPLFAIGCGSLLFGEPLTARMVGGALLVLVATGLVVSAPGGAGSRPGVTVRASRGARDDAT